MMRSQGTELIVDGIIFTFPEEWLVSIFDEWEQYRKPAGSIELKGCDIIAFDGEVLWLIEVKDYTYLDAAIPENLTKIVGQKAAGTMALLYALQRNPAQSEASDFARNCSTAKSIHLALHIEVKDGGRKAQQVTSVLMPYKTKLRNTSKTLGLAKAYISSRHIQDVDIPWSARRDPGTRDRHSDRR